MSKFWQKTYLSKYSGAEIDAAIAKADTVPAVTVEDAGSALVVDDEGKIVAGNPAGNAVFTDPVNFVSIISEATAVVTMRAGINNVGALPFRDLTTEYGNLQFIPKPKAVVNVDALTAQAILATGTGSFSCSTYVDAVNGGNKDLDLNVADYFNYGDEIEMNMSTDMCVLRCVEVSKPNNSVTFGGSFLTAANPLLANKLIYVSLVIQGDGTKWTSTFSVIKYSLST